MVQQFQADAFIDLRLSFIFLSLGLSCFSEKPGYSLSGFIDRFNRLRDCLIPLSDWPSSLPAMIFLCQKRNSAC